MKKLKKPVIISLIIGGAIALLFGFLKHSLHGRFFAGTNIAGIDLSYKTADEARLLLNQAVENYLKSPLKISIEEKTATTTPQELGIKFFISETLDSLESINAKNTSILKFLSPAKLIDDRTGLIVEIDRSAFLQKIDREFHLQDMAPKTAIFYFEKGSKLAIHEGEKGMAADIDAAIRRLKNSARSLESTNIDLELSEKEPAITAAMLEQQKENITQQLRHQFTLVDPVYSDDWNLKLTDHLDWVTFASKQKAEIARLNYADILDAVSDNSNNGAEIIIEIDQAKLDSFVDEKISKWLDRPPAEVKIYQDENKKVIIEGQGDNGLKVHRKQLKKAIELAIAHRIKDVPIPVVQISPVLNVSKELQEMGIKERLAVGHTSYYRSPPNRVHNIKVGAAKFNGKLIAPGETFSFNKNLGRVDANTGYKKELVIKKEGTLPDFGGGVCQVSTTMFRTVLFSGLSIVERNQHTYAVSYYSQILGHGLDATIFLGGPDLRFKNDTDGHLLIQTYTENDYELYIVFYGTPAGRTVKMEGPYLSDYRQPGPVVYEESSELAPGETKQVEKEHVGFHALWYRHITDEFGNTVTEPIETNYHAIPAKILTGPPLKAS